MCVSPKISLATALIEFIAVVYMWFRFTKTAFNKFIMLFVFLLGFYQFTEFMLCSSAYSELWGRLGFITYTILPALGLHFCLVFLKMKFPNWVLYIPVLIFSAIAIFTQDFVLQSSCNLIFARVQNVFFDPENITLAMMIYWGYYLLYLFIICVLGVKGLFSEKNKRRKILILLAVFSVVLTLLSALVLITIFPSLGIRFPSVYCEIALFFTLTGLIAAYLNEKT